MRDLNDLYYFVQVVEHGSFSRAAEALGMAKSKLSRRVAQLEERLGVCLIQRSTRKFSVTELGQDFYRHSLAMVVEADAAHEVIERTRTEPQGVVRVSCPSALLYFLVADMLTKFMAAHPRIQVQLDSTNRAVDVIGEGFDVALRVRFPPFEDSALVMRVLGDSSQRLVASPATLGDLRGQLTLDDLGRLPSVDWGPAGREHAWSLHGPDGATATVLHTPRLVTDDLVAMRFAALNGVGIAQLPTLLIQDDLRQGKLVDAIPQWQPRSGIVHAVFPSRRGLLPSVRALLDSLANEFQALIVDVPGEDGRAPMVIAKASSRPKPARNRSKTP